jgi:predicted porin
MRGAVAVACALTTGTVLGNVARAQSSVTIYGILDEGVNYISNTQVAQGAGRTGGHVFSLTSGAKQGSRFGFRGAEDLGGGMKAIFTLENGLDLSSGKAAQGGLLFGRQAFVGLATRYGSLTLGRQYDSGADYVGGFSAASNWAGNIGAHPGDIDNLNYAYRTNNSIKYSSVSYGGFKFGGMYSLGGVAGDVSRNQVWSLGAGFSANQFAFGISFVNARSPNLSYFGTTGTAGGATTNNLGATSLTGVQGNPVFSGYASAHSEQIFGAGASYTAGGLTVGTTYSNIRFSSLGDLQSGPNPVRYQGTAIFNDAELNVSYFITPALLAGASYNFLNNSGAGGQQGAKYHQVDLALDYFLSARTDVYVIGIYQKASGRDSTGQPAVASLNTLTPSNSDRIALIRMGLRQKF